MEKPVSLFIVDDDLGMLQTLSYILKEKGYEVDTAKDGFEAMERIKEKTFDIVLMDIKMPGMNGVELLRQLKKLSPDTIVVMMTAYSLNELIREAKKEGALCVLLKPLDLEKMMAFIEQFSAQQPILILDDDFDFCRSLQNILKSKGFAAAFALKVDEAINLIMENKYAVIFLDMKLNSITGQDAAVALKKIDPKALIILITGYQEQMAKEIQKTLIESAYCCLYKPLDIDALLGLLKNIKVKQLEKILGDC